jgi:hypothetical protein
MDKTQEVAGNNLKPVAMVGESESIQEACANIIFTRDASQLGPLGYKQGFFRASDVVGNL